MSVLTRKNLMLIPVALVAGVSLTAQAAPDDDNYQGEAADRYAMVRTLEGEVTIRKGELEEALTRGTPVAEGDFLESRGRGVLQLADGTRIAFDGGTRFQVAALFKNGNGERQVLLRLDHGRLRISLGGEAFLRVDTPSGTVTMRERAVATLEAARDQVVRVRVSSGRITFANARDEASLAAGERMSIYSSEDRLDRVRTFNTFEQDAFETWADASGRADRGESYRRVPREIRHYADDLDQNGDWVEVEDAGWCWRPRVNVEWRPYWRGRWGAYSGGLTWVSDDPFGYVTSHFGRWGWTLNWGWYWIPGVHYSPAWVAWNWSGGNCGWAPLNYWNSPTNWGYGAWGGGHCWNVVSAHNFHQRNLDRHIYSDANVLRHFTGNRDLRAPWTRGPVVVTQAELRNPAQLTRAFEGGVRRDRIQAYDRQIQTTTGRAILRRESSPTPTGGTGSRDQRTPFEDRTRYQPRPDPRREQGNRETPPQGRGEARPTAPREERRPLPTREPGPEIRPVVPRQERRTEPPRDRPQERSVEPRPVFREERRQETPRESPRDRGNDSRPSEPRQERRPDPPREHPAESRPSAPPPERRPDPPRESRPSGNAGSERPSPGNSERRH